MLNYLFLDAEAAETAEETAETSSFSWSDFLAKVINWCETSGLKLLIGLIVLFILFKIINVISKKVKEGLLKKNKDKTLVNVVYQLLRKGLKIALFILFLGYVGIDTAGIGSIIASCAVAVGLALQGSLSNIAGWFIIIVMRPFKIGDYIVAQGEQGTVEDIHLFHTYLTSPDNKVIIIPNGTLANGNIVNLSVKDTRRVDFVFTISYASDINKAMKVIYDAINNHALALKNPEPFVRLSNCTDSGIEITTRVWTKNGDYWTVYFDLLQQVKDGFDKENIVVPFNQLDVHIDNK